MRILVRVFGCPSLGTAAIIFALVSDGYSYAFIIPFSILFFLLLSICSGLVDQHSHPEDYPQSFL